jgi:hypothetical protein
MRQILAVSIVAGSMFLVGCEEKKKEAAPAAPAAAAPAAPAAAPAAPGAAAPAAPGAAPAAPAAPGAAAPAAAGGDIGVAECDDYIKKMEACLGKMPAATKAAAEQGFKASKDAWKTAAATPQGKEGLKTACKAAGDALAANPACK